MLLTLTNLPASWDNMNSTTNTPPLEYDYPEPMYRPTFGKWILVASGTVNFSLAIAVPVSLSVMFLDWQDSFQASRAYTAAINSTCVGTLFAGGILAGYLTDRIGSRMTVLVGAFLSTLGLFLSCFATSIHFLIVTTGVIAGFGFCLLQLPSVPCVSQPFTKYKSLVIAICVFGAALLNLALPSLYKLLAHQYSWRGAYIIISGLTMNTFVTGLIMTSNIKPRKSSKTVGTTKLITVDENKCGYQNDENIENRCEVNSKSICDNKNLEESRCKNEKEYNHKSTNLLSACNQSSASEPMGKALNHRDGEIDFQIKTGIRNVYECNSLQTSDSTCEPLKNHKLCKDISIHEETVFLNKEHLKSNLSHENCSYLLHHIRSTKWRFLLDPLFSLLLLFIMLNLGCAYSFYLMLMDFAKTSGFPDEETGILFIVLSSAASLVGRISVGLLNLLPKCHSFVLVCMCGFCVSFSMAVLGLVTDFGLIILLLLLVGAGVGGTIAIYPKCVLDLNTVELRTFSLALGFVSTVEGLGYVIVPVLIGYMVDVTGSYLLTLITLGIIGSVITLILLLGFCLLKASR